MSREFCDFSGLKRAHAGFGDDGGDAFETADLVLRDDVVHTSVCLAVLAGR
jgi:hypothetical protein